MILYLECRSYGIALDIPTTRDEATSTIFSLIAGFEDEPAEISISGVNSPIPNLYPYIQHADLDTLFIRSSLRNAFEVYCAPWSL